MTTALPCCEGEPKLSVDLNRNEITYGAHTWRTSPRYAEILFVFSKQWPKEIDRNEVMMSVHGVNAEICPQLFGVQVVHLRDILAPLGIQITAAHRQGYRLVFPWEKFELGKWYPDNQLDVLKSYQNGEKLVDIAKRHGTTPAAIVHLAKRNGIPLRYIPGRTAERNAEIISLFKAGWHPDKLAQKYRLEIYYVNRIINDAGLSTLRGKKDRRRLRRRRLKLPKYSQRTSHV